MALKFITSRRVLYCVFICCGLMYVSQLSTLLVKVSNISEVSVRMYESLENDMPEGNLRRLNNVQQRLKSDKVNNNATTSSIITDHHDGTVANTIIKNTTKVSTDAAPASETPVANMKLPPPRPHPHAGARFSNGTWGFIADVGLSRQIFVAKQQHNNRSNTTTATAAYPSTPKKK